MRQHYVYIMASKKNGTLYIGVTNDLLKRVHEHKNDLMEGFTGKYHVHDLVYYEVYKGIADAITREKRMKKWKRQWKIELIEKSNAQWRDLYSDIMEWRPVPDEFRDGHSRESYESRIEINGFPLSRE